MIDDEVTDPSLRRLWREVVESCNLTMYNGAAHSLVPTVSNRVCSACKRRVQAATDPWVRAYNQHCGWLITAPQVWNHVDNLGFPLEGSVCRDCMWPHLVKVRAFLCILHVSMTCIDIAMCWYYLLRFSF